MILEVFPSGPFETNAYVLACPQTFETAIIDPGVESASDIQDFIAEHHLIPKMILLTHSHWDHFGDAAELKKKYHIPVYVHPEDAENIRNPGSDRLPLFVPIQGVEPDGFLNEGDIVKIGNLQLSVIHTPGHTPGGVCFYDPQHAVLLSGDTLFKHTIGNLSFPTARPHLMWPSLKKLAKLPPETKVYPGHGESTTIGDEPWLSNAEAHFGD